jgi:protein O-GlcNAc transferase
MMQINQGLDADVEFYEQAIASNPSLKSNYWHLGLALLLQGQADAAQFTWLSAISGESPEELEPALIELYGILETEAQNREAIADYNAVWLIRQQICEQNPEDLNNLLKLVLASIEIQQFTPEGDINLAQVIELLTYNPPIEFELSPPILLSRVLSQVIQFDSSTASNSCQVIPEFTSACVVYYQALEVQNPDIAKYAFLLGNIYTEIGQTEAAIACYKKALESNPNYAEVYFGLGNLSLNQGNEDEAIAHYQQAISIQPNFARPYVNLAHILSRRSQPDAAILHLRQAIEIEPNLVEAHRNLGILLRSLGKIKEAVIEFEHTLSIKPNDFSSYANLGEILAALGKQNEAIPYFQAALALQPQNFGIHFELGNIFSHRNQLDQAIASYQAAIKLNPDFLATYNYLVAVLIRKTDLGEPFYELWRQITSQYADLCDRLHSQRDAQALAQTWITPYSMMIRSNLMSGNHQAALDKFRILEPQIYHHPQDLTQIDIGALYGELLFYVLFLRDDRAANTKFFRQTGELYLNQILKPTQDSALLQLCQKRLLKPKNQGKLKIAILSKSFRRHATAWCCANFIEELSKLTPALYLYDTGKFRDDDMTAKLEQIAAKYYRPQANSFQEIGKLVTAELLKDEVDIILELDSMMNVVSAEVLSYHPAPVCVSWPGLEAPFLSEQNYFICDRHLIPQECDRHYLEQIVRMPDSYLAVTDIKSDPIDRDQVRRSLGITPDQVVYLSITAGHKFNRAVATAAVQILQQVPNSVLLCKGKGDAALIQGIYQQECELLGVESDRIKFLPPRASTEEAHRSTYAIADVLLDSHPYNSCTHTLEALWLNLPIVTIVGDQFFARFGYSFLQTLNIQDGIAWNWEEYVDWAVRFGLDPKLRNSIRAHLAQSKQPETRSPLWNPQKFAIDMYQIFEDLLSDYKAPREN